MLGAAALCGCAGNNCCSNMSEAKMGLKDAIKDNFVIGTAVCNDFIIGADPRGTEACLQHFNSLSPENCLKAEEVHPADGVYEFTIPDEYVEFGMKNNMFIHGHALVWHSQCPDWFFENADGSTVSYDVLKARLEEHIATVMGRYKGKIKSWDVINESVLESGEMRPSKWYQILGDDLVEIAFEAAAKADPDCQLYLNDYNMTNPGKRAKYVEIIKRLQSKGIKIDGMGLQGHWGLTSPSLESIQETIDMFANLGVKVSITELDMSILPSVTNTAAVEQNFGYQKSLDPWDGKFPQEEMHDWNYRMQQFFQIFKDNASKIERVTVWGLTDDCSWRNYWPVVGRKDYATLLTRDYQIKPVDFWIMKNF